MGLMPKVHSTLKFEDIYISELYHEGFVAVEIKDNTRLIHINDSSTRLLGTSFDFLNHRSPGLALVQSVWLGSANEKTWFGSGLAKLSVSVAS